MHNDPVPSLVEVATRQLDAHFAHLPVFTRTFDLDAIGRVLAEVADRMADNYPYQHPLYAGQMLKPPHPIARAAYALAMNINPNNHARDGGRASSAMEIEAVRHIAQMFGWTEFLGHLTSSGTLANLEALWVAGRLQPSGRILCSSQAHYTHQRISGVLQLTCDSVAADARGRMRLDALEDELKKGDVSTVVVTCGTTALGAVDPLVEILKLREVYHFRIHVDAAYGGYFRLIADDLEPEAATAYRALDQVDSIVIDPHKHGLQPYGCGCVLFRDPSVGRFYKHDSPYTYFTSNELHLGEISLECSRAGSSAVALWATHQLLPLTKDGEFAAGLRAGRAAAMELYRRLAADGRFEPLLPMLDIVNWRVRAEDAGASSALATEIFGHSAEHDLHLALVQLPLTWFVPSATAAESVTCLRSVLMKPEHLLWMEELWGRFERATKASGL